MAGSGGCPASRAMPSSWQSTTGCLSRRRQPWAQIRRPIARTYQRGTFGALVNDFLASGQFKTKKERTRGEYERICWALQDEHGRKRVAHLERRHVRQIRDAKVETPGAANNVLRMLKILLNFAVDDGLIKASPAAKFKELPVGEWRAWTDDECVKFEKRWVPGTMQRRAYALALYTGQRKRDQIIERRARTVRTAASTWCSPRRTRSCGYQSTAS